MCSTSQPPPSISRIRSGPAPNKLLLTKSRGISAHGLHKCRPPTSASTPARSPTNGQGAPARKAYFEHNSSGRVVRYVAWPSTDTPACTQHFMPGKRSGSSVQSQEPHSLPSIILQLTPAEPAQLMPPSFALFTGPHAEILDSNPCLCAPPATQPGTRAQTPGSQPPRRWACCAACALAPPPARAAEAGSRPTAADAPPPPGRQSSCRKGKRASTHAHREE